MNKIILATILAFPVFANAEVASYTCDAQKAVHLSDGSLSTSPVYGKASVIDKGDSFVALVKDGVSIQSPELTSNGKNLNGYSKDGTEFIKGDGFFIIGDDSSGYILTSCTKK